MPLARLGLDDEKLGTGSDLAEALAGTDLPSDAAQAWGSDLQAARKAQKAHANQSFLKS